MVSGWKLPKLKWLMSHKLPVISGEDMVRFLIKQGFAVRRQTSSHIIVQKEWRVFSVPLHRELKKGTQIAILKQAGITVDDFKRHYR
jgi:predicted RNA binding protein YcfA (HicA-like mRNA interferase family)